MIYSMCKFFLFDCLIFSFDYDIADTNNILGIHKYLMKETWYKMFAFIKKMFIGLLNACTTRSFGESLASNSKGCLKCLNNRPHKAWPTLINIDFNHPLHYPFTAVVDKCGGSCSTIDGPNAWICAPNKVTDVNVKVLI